MPYHSPSHKPYDDKGDLVDMLKRVSVELSSESRKGGQAAPRVLPFMVSERGEGPFWRVVSRVLLDKNGAISSLTRDINRNGSPLRHPVPFLKNGEALKVFEGVHVYSHSRSVLYMIGETVGDATVLLSNWIITTADGRSSAYMLASGSVPFAKGMLGVNITSPAYVSVPGSSSLLIKLMQADPEEITALCRTLGSSEAAINVGAETIRYFLRGHLKL
jgi:hypothetical protein